MQIIQASRYVQDALSKQKILPLCACNTQTPHVDMKAGPATPHVDMKAGPVTPHVDMKPSRVVELAVWSGAADGDSDTGVLSCSKVTMDLEVSEEIYNSLVKY